MSNQLILSTYGQIVIGDSTDTRIGFVYSNEEITDDSWNTSLFDPRIARTFGSSRIYALWSNEHGYYYSLIDKNPDDERNGFIMLTIFSKKSKINNGKAIVESLVALWRTIVIENNTDAQILNTLLTPLSKYQQRSYTLSDATLTGIKGYRLYSSENDLYKIMQLPDQTEYSKYDRILIAPEGSPRPDIQTKTDYEKLESRIRESYYVYKSSDDNSVLSNKNYVERGDSLILTYRKEYCKEEYFQIIINGEPSTFFEYNGYEIHLKSASDAGIVFKKRMELNFTCQGRRVISQINYSNSSVAFEVENGILFIPDGTKEITFTVSSIGYKTQQVTLNETDLTARFKNIELEEKCQDIILTYLDKEGYSKRGLVSVKMTDPIYEALLNLSISNTPINKKERSKKNDDEDEGNIGKKNNEKKNSIFSILKNKKSILLTVLKYIGIIFASIILLFLGYTCTMWCFVGEDYDPFAYFTHREPQPAPIVVADTAKIVSSTINDQDSTTEISVVPSNINVQDSLEDVDLSYLKMSDIWIGDSIQSIKYKELFSGIVTNDVELLINHGYKNEPNEKRNGYWQISNIDNLIKNTSIKDKVIQDLSNALPECYSETKNEFNLIRFKEKIYQIKSKYNSGSSTGGSSQTQSNNVVPQGNNSAGRMTSGSKK